jgi:hypothetical protein
MIKEYQVHKSFQAFKNNLKYRKEIRQLMVKECLNIKEDSGYTVETLQITREKLQPQKYKKKIKIKINKCLSGNHFLTMQT